MHLTKAHAAFLSLSAAALIGLPGQTQVQAQTPNGTSSSMVAETNAMPQADSLNTAAQAARDAVFVNFLLIACASLGAIIAFVVWRSLPPKSKADTKNT